MTIRFVLGFLVGFLIGASIALAISTQAGDSARSAFPQRVRERSLGKTG